MRCISCMKEIEDGLQICSFCNYPQDAPAEHPDSLAPGTELRNRFVLGKELGRGGFGITYVGYDKYLDCKVAIKEYFPQTLVSRFPGQTKMLWLNNQLRDAGCQNVIREAQKMHRIGILPVAVHVLDVFYENNTAYIAMDFVDGITLKQYLLKNGVMSPGKCMELMLPILETMIQMHDAGIIHRDISPDNIMIQPDLKPRILDLGAAKDIQMESGNTMLVARNGFSPMEQYRTNGNIGTWTDVYALCATMYYCLTGKVPPAAMDRSEKNDALPFNPAWNLPEKMIQVLQDGMRMNVELRIPNVSELRKRLEDSLRPESAAIVDEIQDSEPSLVTPPVIAQNTHPTPQPTPPTEEKAKGFLPALMALFGKKKKADTRSASSRAERKPGNVVISDPNARPVYTDPDATVCLDDEEETILIGSEQPVVAKATLTQVSTEKSVEITKCCFVLGRLTNTTSGGKQSSADCMIEDSTKHISRRHAIILFDGEDFYLQDISGKNTTSLNGIRIQNDVMPENGRIFASAYKLYDGDSIQLADEQLRFSIGGRL